MFNWRATRKCLYGTTPEPAPRLVINNPEALGRIIDMRPEMPPVENQLEVGSCTANAVVGALEYARAKEQLKHIELSRLFVYYNARKLHDTTQEDSGCAIQMALAALMVDGVCEERMWPYDAALVKEKPTNAALMNATKYEAIEFARVDFPDNVFQALLKGLPVIFSTFLPDICYEAAWAGQPAPVLKECKQDMMGGCHAMLLVGYNMDTRHFIVRNSWGPEFGDGGYFLVPFETLHAYSIKEHFWVIGKLSDKQTGRSVEGQPMQQAIQSLLGSGARHQAQQPQQLSAAAAVLASPSQLRGQLMQGVDTTRKGIRDRLRGPGSGGGY
jgi:hypothetical protein